MDDDPVHAVYTPRRQLLVGGLVAVAATIAAGFSGFVAENTNPKQTNLLSDLPSQTRCQFDGNLRRH